MRQVNSSPRGTTTAVGPLFTKDLGPYSIGTIGPGSVEEIEKDSERIAEKVTTGIDPLSCALRASVEEAEEGAASLG